jgi:hypothetical protein
MPEHVAPGWQSFSCADLRAAGKDKAVRLNREAKLRSIIASHQEGGGNLFGDRDGYIMPGLGFPDH